MVSNPCTRVVGCRSLQPGRMHTEFEVHVAEEKDGVTRNELAGASGHVCMS
jgi:hypothetical protein